MAKKSAGILVYRFSDDNMEVLLVHPGGPFFAKKDAGAWSIPKGEFTDELPLAAARREFAEETGILIDGEFFPLSPVTQKSGKVVYAWAIEADMDASKMTSNLFEIEWPPHSGKKQLFPEVDKAQWFEVEEAKLKIAEAQADLLVELVKKLKS